MISWLKGPNFLRKLDDHEFLTIDSLRKLLVDNLPRRWQIPIMLNATICALSYHMYMLIWPAGCTDEWIQSVHFADAFVWNTTSDITAENFWRYGHYFASYWDQNNQQRYKRTGVLLIPQTHTRASEFSKSSASSATRSATSAQKEEFGIPHQTQPRKTSRRYRH